MHTIDQNEVDKFSKLADNWWDLNGEFKILHTINPIRLQYITEKIIAHFNIKNDKFNTINLLDYGCGGGLVSIPLAQNHFNICGIDASDNNVEIARIQAKKLNLNIDFQNINIEELVAQNQQFEVVLCLEVIEHVLNLEHFLKQLSQLVKPGGMIIISTLNKTIKSYLLGVIAAEYILGWVPKGTHEYQKFVKPSQLNSLFEQNNFTLKDLTGLVFNPLTNEWKLSNQDISINYFAYAKKN